jgi:cell filamentation protein
MYEAEQDPYCYPGTSVLINRLDIRDQAALDAFEADISAERSSQEVPPGSLDYDHYLAIHRHLFQDVYEWAGEIRTVRIAKEGSAFCYPEHIDREMRRLFSELDRQKHFRERSPADLPQWPRIFSPSSTPFIRSAKATVERNCRF